MHVQAKNSICGVFGIVKCIIRTNQRITSPSKGAFSFLFQNTEPIGTCVPSLEGSPLDPRLWDRFAGRTPTHIHISRLYFLLVRLLGNMGRMNRMNPRDSTTFVAQVRIALSKSMIFFRPKAPSQAVSGPLGAGGRNGDVLLQKQRNRCVQDDQKPPWSWPEAMGQGSDRDRSGRRGSGVLNGSQERSRPRPTDPRS